MNQIYRVIFNHATGVYQCVSEFARAKGKSKSIKTLAPIIGLAMSGQVWAVDYNDGQAHTIVNFNDNEIYNVSGDGTTLTKTGNLSLKGVTVNVSDNAKVQGDDTTNGNHFN